jgi:23S rRNA pseudouridine955/2504/2580 synthase
VVKFIIGAAQATAKGNSMALTNAPAAAAPAAAAVRHLTVDEGSDGQRLDNYLLRELKGAPKTLVYRIIRSGEVRVNKGRASAETRVATGDDIRVPPLRLAEPDAAAERAVPGREFPLLLEDDHLIAIAKPAGVAVHGGSGVAFGVIEQMRRARPQAKFLELVHRLDKETSGILLLAKKRSALTNLQEQFRQRQTDKTYAALVIGAWPASLKRIDASLVKTLDANGERRVRVVTPGELRTAIQDANPTTRRRTPDEDEELGQRSITLVRLLQQLQGYSLLDVTIKTGRTHQIRVHLQHAGHAIVGDDKYGDFALNHELARSGLAGAAPGQPRLRFERMFLHARRLGFVHPATGERVTLEAPLPADCQALLDRLALLDAMSAMNSPA